MPPDRPHVLIFWHPPDRGGPRIPQVRRCMVCNSDIAPADHDGECPGPEWDPHPQGGLTKETPMPPDDDPRQNDRYNDVEHLHKVIDDIVAANGQLCEQLRAAEALPKVDLSGYQLRYRVEDVQDFQYVTGATMTAMWLRYDAIEGEESEEETKKRRKQDEDAYTHELAMNCVSMGQPGLELWIVDPAKATAVKTTGDPSV